MLTGWVETKFRQNLDMSHNFIQKTKMLDEKCHLFILECFQKFLSEFSRIHPSLVEKARMQPFPFSIVIQFLRNFPIKNPFLKVFQNILKKNFSQDIHTCEDLANVLNRCTSELKEKIRQEYNGNYENFETALYQYLLV